MKNALPQITTKKRDQQKRIIRRFYELNRPVTDQELEAEIKNLERRRDAHILDDFSSLLAARLGLI